MSKRLYLLTIEIFWWVEHRKSETLSVFGFRNRKLWEHKYVAKYKENIYGDKW